MTEDKRKYNRRPSTWEEPKKIRSIRLTDHAWEWLKAKSPSASDWIEKLSRKKKP